MTATPPPEYVLARSVLLDALQALQPNLDALVLVGAQAVYGLGAKTDEAVSALSKADALAPKEVRCRPIARDLVHDLRRQSRRAPSLALQGLVEHVGLPA